LLVAVTVLAACGCASVAVARTLAVAAQPPVVAAPFVTYLDSPGRPPLRDQPYAHRRGGTLSYDVTYPSHVDDATPAVVLLHGGGWWSGDKSDMRGSRATPAAIADAGFVAISANYRLACTRTSSSRPDEPFVYRNPEALCGAHVMDQVADVTALLAHLRAHAATLHIDAHRIALLGMSSGGHLALLTAASARAPERSVRAVVNWSGAPAVDFISREPLLPASSEYSIRAAFTNAVGCDLSACPKAWQRADPTARLTASTPPFAVYSVAGEDETQVPIGEVRAFHARLDELGFTNAYAAGDGTCHAVGCANYPLASSTTTALSASIEFLHEQLDARPDGHATR
jgi:acetyl esterase/lipase